MKCVWAVFVLLTSVASNPVMKYSFCPLSNALCEPTSFASDSSLEFGKLATGVLYYELGETKLLSISCTFHEPLHWLLTADQDVQVNSISSNVTLNGSHQQYYYHIFFNEARPGLIRCENYQNPDLAAEIFIAQRDPMYDYFKVNHLLLEYFPRITPQQGWKLIVPCTMYRFDPNLDMKTFMLKKMRRRDMLAPKLTRECLSCFPNPNEYDEANCTTSCPYGISHRIWADAGKPRAVNKTGNHWLDCVRDSDCAFEALKKAPKAGKSDCNGDVEITCSDYFSVFTSHPSDCESGSTSFTHFREIEACIVEKFSRSLNSTEVDYDPRVGFRLKTEKDMEAVYVCPTPGVYYSPYNPATQIDARLEVNSDKALTGIVCTVPQKWMEDVTMRFLRCATLFDCELQLKTVEVEASFRNFNDILNGSPISEISPRLYGKIIQNPPRSGVVECKGKYKYDTGYILDLQYFFIGLDSKSYFLSNSIPDEALISIKNLTRSDGFEIEVECTVATFIIFPDFEFIVEYSNGTITSKSDQTIELQQTASKRLNQLVNNDDTSVVSIRCRALFRNSERRVEAIFKMESDPNTPFFEADPKVTQGHVVVILAGTSIVLVLGAVSCAVYGVRKYKNSKKLRQLTLDEINEFWNGNAAIATGSGIEVNVDGIGFPECFQIPPTDLKMHMQEVLGEGEFGRCVCGDLHEQKVAVKTTKASMDAEAFKEFLREVKVMAYLGKHENIVQFLGAVVNQLRDRICIAVIELSPYGDLLSYLRQNDKGNPSNVSSYANLSHEGPHEGPQGPKLGIKHLSYFCEQIAAAMEFVVEKRVIHGDLAARNVLVFPNDVVKITDFGLSRKLYAASNYKKKNITPLPWRWMAVESLKYLEFSPMTDMWAYGVTVWEIFTLGEVPYAGLVYSQEFIDEVEQGRRLPRPKTVSEEIYQFMRLSWDRIPSARPSFRDARIFFRRLSGRSQW